MLRHPLCLPRIYRLPGPIEQRTDPGEVRGRKGETRSSDSVVSGFQVASFPHSRVLCQLTTKWKWRADSLFVIESTGDRLDGRHVASVVRRVRENDVSMLQLWAVCPLRLS